MVHQNSTNALQLAIIILSTQAPNILFCHTVGSQVRSLRRRQKHYIPSQIQDEVFDGCNGTKIVTQVPFPGSLSTAIRP